jgi:propanol-preferring alcohol dehydrogenase
MIPAEPADFIGRGLRIMGTSTGTLQDTQEALELARRGLVKPMCVEAKLEDVDGLLVQLEKSQIAGRYVVKL